MSPFIHDGLLRVCSSLNRTQKQYIDDEHSVRFSRAKCNRFDHHINSFLSHNFKTMPPRQRGPRWGIADNAKFTSLAENGKINPRRQDKHYIEKVRQKFWKDRKFTTFKANWKAKTADWEAHTALQRSRQGRSK